MPEQASLFRLGDTVRVKSYQHGVEWRRPHIRTPGYVYGVNGRVVDVCGEFGDPSFLAFGIECPKVWLYRVVRKNLSMSPFFLFRRRCEIWYPLHPSNLQAFFFPFSL